MTPTDVANMALDQAGVRDAITSFSEVSREAEVANRWYGAVRDQVLRAAFWPSATGHFKLAVSAERDPDVAWTSAAPDPGWRFAYSAPSDMIAPRYLSDFSRFVLSNASNGSRIIVAQAEGAVLTYTKRQEEPDAWDAALKMAIIYALAAHVAIPLTGTTTIGGRGRLVDVLAEKANSLILEARVGAANDAESVYETLPEWIAARGYTGNTLPSKFFYPYGPMISVTEGVGVT